MDWEKSTGICPTWKSCSTIQQLQASSPTWFWFHGVILTMVSNERRIIFLHLLFRQLFENPQVPDEQQNLREVGLFYVLILSSKLPLVMFPMWFRRSESANKQCIAQAKAVHSVQYDNNTSLQFWVLRLKRDAQKNSSFPLLPDNDATVN